MSRTKQGSLKDVSRSHELYTFEHRFRDTHRYIAGVDEVGRGPMAGPVVAAAVILPASPEIPGIDDSKRLTPKKRLELFDVILETSVAFGIGVRSSRVVDEKGIVGATFSAMRLSLATLALKGYAPDLVLVDAFPIPGITYAQNAIVHGDALSASIASASIIAKVTRDRMMAGYDTIYPGYGFAGHKGYCTGEHRTSVSRIGICPIHRRSFSPVADSLDETGDST